MQTATDQPAKDLNYRPDIDGLRAFAVLSVLGFHAFPRWFPGGFIGVDVFFVISGFLITNIILTGLQKNSFSLRTFYGKRIQRIFPALYVVLLGVYFMGWFVLIGPEFNSFGKHILAGSAFASNLVLYGEAGYFDKATVLKPLLHLWSLSIEEQFYIIWPLLLLLLWKTKLPLAVSLLVLVLVSFALSNATLQNQPVAAFYLLQNRAWELGIGGLFAVLTLFHRPRLRSILANLSNSTTLKTETIRGILSFSGLFLLVVAVFFFNAGLPFPGWRALLPTLGALFIVAAGKEAWVNNKLLSQRIAVAIGLISFPLYLWHWPLISFLHITKQDYPSSASRFFALALSFLLAWLTYRFIEKPLRFGKPSAFRNPLLFSCILVFGAIGLLTSLKGIGSRAESYNLQRFGQAQTDWYFPLPVFSGVTLMKGDYELLHFQDLTFSLLLNKSNPDETLYLGDSEMRVYSSRINHLAAKQSKQYNSAVFATDTNCPPIQDIKIIDHTNSACEALPATALAYAEKPEVKTVVIGGRWSAYFNSTNFYFDDGTTQNPLTQPAEAEKAYHELEKMLRGLKQQKKRTYLILEPPSGQPLDPAEMVIRDFNFATFKFDFTVLGSNGVTRSEMAKTDGAIIARLKKIARQTGTIIIDPRDTLCHGDVCPALTKDGIPIYMDAWHPRQSYIREYGTFLDQTLKAN